MSTNVNEQMEVKAVWSVGQNVQMVTTYMHVICGVMFTDKVRKSDTWRDLVSKLFCGDRWHFSEVACGVLWRWGRAGLSLRLPNQYLSELLHMQSEKHATPMNTTCKWWRYCPSLCCVSLRVLSVLYCPIMSFYFLLLIIWIWIIAFCFPLVLFLCIVLETKRKSWVVINYIQTKEHG